MQSSCKAFYTLSSKWFKIFEFTFFLENLVGIFHIAIFDMNLMNCNYYFYIYI